MKVYPCSHVRDGQCCRARCAAPPAHVGFTENRGHLVEHQRCAAHTDDLDQRRIRQVDPRWKAIAG